MMKFTAGIVLGSLLTAVSGAAAYVVAEATTNGVLEGYVVQKDGAEVCRDPMVQIQFRGPTSYITCDWQD